MKIKEVSEITGLTAVTLRYYEKSGLIPSIQRIKEKMEFVITLRQT